MVKYTASTLEKLESLIESLQFKIRYEKGNFKSGFCIINDKKIVVVNRFYNQESRINALIEILGHLPCNEFELTKSQLTVYYTFLQQHSSRSLALVD